MSKIKFKTPFATTVGIGPVFETQEDKWNHVLKTASDYKCNILIEFGTYKGQGVLHYLNNGHFKKIISVEPVKEYFNESKEHLSKFENVELYNQKAIDYLTDSNLQEFSDDKILFFIDSHPQPPFVENSSMDLMDELNYIIENFKNSKYICLVDDVRIWGQKQGHPLKYKICKLLEDFSSHLEHYNDTMTFVP